MIVGNRVFVTGQFTQARPAGADPGTNDTRAKGDHNVAAAFRAWEGLNPESVLFSPARNAGQRRVVVRKPGPVPSEAGK